MFEFTRRCRSCVMPMVFLVALCPSVQAGAAETWAERADRESHAILQSLIATESKPLPPCVFSDQWVQRPAAAEQARKHLGLNLYADVLAPEDGRRPANIIDPADAMKEIFCSEEDFMKERKQAFEDLDSGTISGSVSRQRIEFGRPVFDLTLRTALVMVTYERVTHIKSLEDAKRHPERYLPNGVVRRNNLHFSAVRYLFRKRGKTWQKIFDHVEAIAE